jgi:hypothetical protein
MQMTLLTYSTRNYNYIKWNINNNNNKKNIVYCYLKLILQKKDYDDEIIWVFSTNDKAEDYKQKLEKHLNNPSNNGPI